MTVLDDLPQHVIIVGRTFLKGLQSILGEDLIGIYLYGAMTFPDSRDTIADIDYHVIVRRPLDDKNRRVIDGLRKDLARDHPQLGEELDGYFVTLDDTHRTADVPTQMHPLWRTPTDTAWALHCAHIRAGRVITLSGPDPLTIYPEPSWDDLEQALWSEMQFVEAHQADAPAYGILNACRILYSMRTRDVVISKKGAAVWGLEHLSEWWHEPIKLALRAYERPPPDHERDAMVAAVGPFVEYVREAMSYGS